MPPKARVVKAGKAATAKAKKKPNGSRQQAAPAAAAHGAAPRAAAATQHPMETGVEKALQAVQATLARLVEAQSRPAPLVPKETGPAAGAGGRQTRKTKKRDTPEADAEGGDDAGGSHDEKDADKRPKHTEDDVQVVLSQAVTGAVISASSLVHAALALYDGKSQMSAAAWKHVWSVGQAFIEWAEAKAICGVGVQLRAGTPPTPAVTVALRAAAASMAASPPPMPAPASAKSVGLRSYGPPSLAVDAYNSDDEYEADGTFKPIDPSVFVSVGEKPSKVPLVTAVGRFRIPYSATAVAPISSVLAIQWNRMKMGEVFGDELAMRKSYLCNVSSAYSVIQSAVEKYLMTGKVQSIMDFEPRGDKAPTEANLLSAISNFADLCEEWHVGGAGGGAENPLATQLRAIVRGANGLLKRHIEECREAMVEAGYGRLERDDAVIQSTIRWLDKGIASWQETALQELEKHYQDTQYVISSSDAGKTYIVHGYKPRFQPPNLEAKLGQPGSSFRVPVRSAAAAVAPREPPTKKAAAAADGGKAYKQSKSVTAAVKPAAAKKAFELRGGGWPSFFKSLRGMSWRDAKAKEPRVRGGVTIMHNGVWTNVCMKHALGGKDACKVNHSESGDGLVHADEVDDAYAEL